jgi:hypothetical protein
MSSQTQGTSPVHDISAIASASSNLRESVAIVLLKLIVRLRVRQPGKHTYLLLQRTTTVQQLAMDDEKGGYDLGLSAVV